jgi:hypothetical protein
VGGGQRLFFNGQSEDNKNAAFSIFHSRSPAALHVPLIAEQRTMTLVKLHGFF